jgi:hypothetical protein
MGNRREDRGGRKGKRDKEEIEGGTKNPITERPAREQEKLKPNLNVRKILHASSVKHSMAGIGVLKIPSAKSENPDPV